MKENKRVLKRYDSTFEIEVSVDILAEQLLKSVAGESTDKAIMIVNSIVGPMVAGEHRHSMKHLYFALQGIDMTEQVFAIGDEYTCTDTYYGYEYIQGTEPVEFDRKRLPIGHCKVIQFNPYHTGGCYQIEFRSLNSKGDSGVETQWVKESLLIRV